jgi:peptidoglycan/xylan/chitin deacetylase (PgdA/CDA1 family)
VAKRAVDALAGSCLGSVQRLSPASTAVALTFDDGPDAECTPEVLDLLAAASARATFFMLLPPARRRPELVHRVVGGGHEIGLHGADHRSLAGLSRREVRDRLASARTELADLSGVPVRLFRPPFGAQTLRSFLGTRDAGLECVVWDVDSLDWRGGDELEVADRVDRMAGPGSIVLLHDGAADTRVPRSTRHRVRTAELVLDRLHARALGSTTVTHLLATGDVHRTIWFTRS